MRTEEHLLESLLAMGNITLDQYHICEIERRRSGASVFDTLVANAFTTASQIARAESHSSACEYVNLESFIPDEQAVAMLPGSIARQSNAVPIGFDPATSQLQIAVANTDDVLLLDRLGSHLQSNVSPVFVIASVADIQQTLDRVYGFKLSIDELLDEMEQLGKDLEFQHREQQDNSHPVVRFVEAVLADGLRRGASDLHFEPEFAFLRLRYRIDGVLRVIRCIHGKYWPFIAARLKVLANLDIAESRLAQDGAFAISFAAARVDVRLSTFPLVHGESIVLRLHSQPKAALSLIDLGFEPRLYSEISHVLRYPSGLIVVAGPTGSGKTTTLYAMLQTLSHDGINIMSLEDPVELRLPLVRQCEVSARGKMTFADGIKGILRQDPDVILVGEIRDREAAKLAFRAALTGHLVLATVHADSLPGVVQRLAELGIAPDQFQQQANIVLIQRLIRLLCNSCKRPRVINPPEVASEMPDDAEDDNEASADENGSEEMIAGTGCPECDFTGFSGRTVIADVASSAEGGFSIVADSSGDGLSMAALQLILAGRTTREEASRVLGPGFRHQLATVGEMPNKSIAGISLEKAL